MNEHGTDDSGKSLEAAASEADKQRYVLRLYVAGSTPRSARAIECIRKLCDEQLSGRYDLEVIDIYQHPELTADDQIIAAPTLVKELPPPLKKLIGDMTDRDRVIVGLNLRPKEK